MRTSIRHLACAGIAVGLSLGTGPARADHEAGHDAMARGGIKALDERLYDLQQDLQAIELTPGPRGEAGPPGPPGPRGPAGPAGGGAVVVDAGGVELGMPLRWTQGNAPEAQVITGTGYVADIERLSGRLSGSHLFTLHFESSDCTGQAWIPSQQVENPDTFELETWDSIVLRGTVARSPSAGAATHLAAAYYVPRDAVSAGPIEARSALWLDYQGDPEIACTTETPAGIDLPDTFDSAVPAFPNDPGITGIPDVIAGPLSIGPR